MKKIFALVLALVMVLTAVSALAAGSKTQSDVSNATVTPVTETKTTETTTTTEATKTNTNTGSVETAKTEAEIRIEEVTPDEKLQAVIDAVTAAQKDGDALKGLPEAVVATIPAERNTINEMKCYKLVGDVSGLAGLEMKFKFDTPYDEGEEVTLLIGISAPDAEEVEWLTLEGKANANKEVVVTVTKEQLAKISNNPFIVIPVSKPASK